MKRRHYRMKNELKPELWKPIVTEHPEPSRIYRRSESHPFIQYQPISERYEVPGLMPSAPRRRKGVGERHV